MSNYLSEAFKKLEILDEDVFDLDKDGLTALKDFEDKDEEDDSIAVIDPDAESEEDLEDSYIGKVILDCSVCHTDIYKDKEDITIDEEAGLANIGEECPYCYSSEGFKVIGEVKPFVETTFETDDDVEVEVDDEEVEKNESFKRKRIIESKKLNEWFESEPFAAMCSIDEWNAFKNGELLFDLDSEELVTLDYAKNNDLKNCLEYDRYEDYGEKVKKDKVVFLMYDPGEEYHYVYEESLHEDTVKQGKYWVNKGDEGTHGKFRTKKAADDQRKAMFAGGFKAEALKESTGEIFHNANGEDYEIIERSKSGSNALLNKGKQWIIAWNCPKNNRGSWGQGHYFFDEDEARELWNKKYIRESKNPIKLPGKSLKESCSIDQCQKWVDYDMKKYKRISDDTMEKIKSSGYSVVKDQYGDYEVIADRKDESLKESIEDITIDTGDQEISVSARDKEKKSDEEMIAPLSDEMKADIEMDSDDIDVDVDEFSEEDFDELGESYLKKVYENVDSYRTTSAKTQGNKLLVEGLIKFNSGKEKKTSFVFESRTITKSGKAKLIGENLQISRGHKSFKLTGTINNGKFISESLNYNYRVKNGSESQRVYGTAKKSK